MRGSRSTVQRGPAERLRAWAITGPLGHLWSACADIAVLWTRWLWSRARERWQAPS